MKPVDTAQLRVSRPWVAVGISLWLWLGIIWALQAYGVDACGDLLRIDLTEVLAAVARGDGR